MTDRRLFWKVHEMIGTPICDLQVYKRTGKMWPLGSIDDIKDAVYDGRKVAVEFMGQIFEGTIAKQGDGWVVNGVHNVGLVEWKGDMWICAGWYNKKALEKVDLKK